MASLIEIKRRINSIKNTAKITHAMELVAAAKMKKAQEQATRGKPYSTLVNSVLRSIASKIDQSAHPLLARPKGDTAAIIFFATDRGLIGSLNSNLFKKVEEAAGNLKFITIGKKARNFVAKSNKELIADFPLAERPDVSSIRPVSKLMIDGFLNKEFDHAHVVYTKFNSTINQEAVIKQLLPIIDEATLKQIVDETEQAHLLEPLFEPDPDTVLETILPQYILMELYQIFLEAKASEHSARMIAMKNATDNARDLADDLTLTYNGIRQEVITKEILDITTAALTLE